ncbi:hypothetical protein JCM11491_000171 [Sporobolomyces phaffii]
MLLGIGTDLMHLARLRALLARRAPQHLAARILSAPELVEWTDPHAERDTKAVERYLSLRWTAKEAAYKALYPRYKPTWKDLVVTKRDKKPRLDFSPAFVAKQSHDAGLDKVKMHLSVSHDGDFMVAHVVVEAE